MVGRLHIRIRALNFSVFRAWRRLVGPLWQVPMNLNLASLASNRLVCADSARKTSEADSFAALTRIDERPPQRPKYMRHTDRGIEGADYRESGLALRVAFGRGVNPGPWDCDFSGDARRHSLTSVYVEGIWCRRAWNPVFTYRCQPRFSDDASPGTACPRA